MINLYNINVTESTPTEPVALQEVKDWIQVDFSDFDTMIEGMLLGSRKTIESFTARALVVKSVSFDLDTSKCDEVLRIPYTNTVTGLTVKSLADDDTETALTAGTDYFSRGSTLRFYKPGRYTVAYTTVADVPEDLKEAIKMEVAERFANRGENQAMRANYDSPSLGISESAKAKARPYRIEWL